jgi:signal transduction histidine kinase
MADEFSAEYAARLERDKLEALKELAYGASHEINNPLANIAARAQTLVEGEADPERRRMLVAIHRQAMRAHEMISDLMLFARPPKLNLAPCDAGQLAARAVDEHRELAVERGIQLEFQAGDEPNLRVMADETQLGVALQALVTNAIQAIGANGHVTVSLRTTCAGDARFVEFAVRDDGPGISEHVRRHMFDPFFSGREAGRGLGFGLSKCWRIVTDHGGRVIVHQPNGRGAEISILLPLADCTPTG